MDDINEVAMAMKEMIRINNLGDKTTKADNFAVNGLRKIIDNKEMFNEGFTELGIAALKELRETAEVMAAHQ